MAHKNIAKKVDAEFAHYAYVCEGCGAEGNLRIGITQGMKPFGCPDGCGATYVMWRNPLNENRYELNCVVCPVFSEESQ